MADIDWTSHYASEGTIRVAMVSQNNLNQNYGDLLNIELDGSSITGAYDTDTRGSGNLTFLDDADAWIRGSFVRIFYDIPEFEYSRTIGTYLVSNDPGTRNNHYWSTKLTLNTMLYALTNDFKKDPWSLAQGAKVRTAIHQILDSSNRPYIDSATNDYSITETTVLENGKSVLEWLYSLTDLADIRLDVDENGFITIKNYISPSNQTPVFRFDLEDFHGIVIDNLSRSSDYLSIPGRAIVVYTYSEQETNAQGKKESVQKQITASADATGDFSPETRGYVIADYYQTNDMTPANQDRANAIAQERIESLAIETVEWSLTTTYLPIWEGDVVELYIHDGPEYYQGLRTCLVNSVDFDLSNKQLTLTLAEV